MDYKLPKRIQNSNKSTFGRVLNIAGSDYMPGAAYLSSVSALKIGCGYCFLSSTERVIDAVAAQTQNVVFVPVEQVKNYLNNTTSVVSIGCGLSQNEVAMSLFDFVIENSLQGCPLVIDADGLNLLAKDSSKYLERKFDKVILTPHPKEAARLLGCTLDDVLANFDKSAIRISEKYNATVVLKSHNTVVVSPDGRKYVNNTGNSSMAKAGSGDVLTGMISGLLAQGMDLFEASVMAVYLHGLCGDFAKEKLTEYSVMADDLISFIPFAIKTVL